MFDRTLVLWGSTPVEEGQEAGVGKGRHRAAIQPQGQRWPTPRGLPELDQPCGAVCGTSSLHINKSLGECCWAGGGGGRGQDLGQGSTLQLRLAQKGLPSRSCLPTGVPAGPTNPSLQGDLGGTSQVPHKG